MAAKRKDIRQYLECPFCADPESRRPKPCLCGKLADWVIVGGESGHGARPFDLAWARDLRDQCKSAGSAFFMKQAGSNAKTFYGAPFETKDRGGADPAEWPEDLRIQQTPEVRT